MYPSLDPNVIVQSLSAVVVVMTLVFGGIRITGYVSDRPTRDEVDKKIQAAVGNVMSELKYIRGKVDDLVKRKR